MKKIQKKIAVNIILFICCFAANAQYWNDNGNTLTGTLPGSPNEWLGSSNSADVIFKTSGTDRARFLSTGQFVFGDNALTGSEFAKWKYNQNASSIFLLTNTNGGASAHTSLKLDNGTHSSALTLYSNGFGTSGPISPNTLVLSTTSAGGMVFSVGQNAGDFYFKDNLAIGVHINGAGICAGNGGYSATSTYRIYLKGDQDALTSMLSENTSTGTAAEVNTRYNAGTNTYVGSTSTGFSATGIKVASGGYIYILREVEG